MGKFRTRSHNGQKGSQKNEKAEKGIVYSSLQIEYHCPPLAYNLHKDKHCRRRGGSSVCGICIGDVSHVDRI